MLWVESTYSKNYTEPGILSEFPAPPATRQGSPPQPQECSPQERFLRHPRPPRRQRQVLHLRKPAQAGREVRHRPPALFDEDPAGEPEIGRASCRERVCQYV